MSFSPTFSPGAVETPQHPSNLGATYVPTTGQTVTLPPCMQVAVLNPVGTLAALTVALNVGPHSGQTRLIFTQAVTALTVTVPTGYTLAASNPSLTAATAGLCVCYTLVGTVFYRS